MEFFYIIVLSIAVIFLILILTLIGVLMKQSKKTGGTFPPIVNNCPDYWVIASDGKSCTIPTKTGSTDIQKNAGSLYGSDIILDIKYKTSYTPADYDPVTVTTPYTFPTYTPGLKYTEGTLLASSSVGSTIDFTHEAWSAQGKTSACAQKQWAQKWGITWDGITNNNTC
jgi:hypothetical protein